MRWVSEVTAFFFAYNWNGYGCVWGDLKCVPKTFSLFSICRANSIMIWVLRQQTRCCSVLWCFDTAFAHHWLTNSWNFRYWTLHLDPLEIFLCNCHWYIFLWLPGGNQNDTSLFPNVNSTWKVCENCSVLFPFLWDLNLMKRC